VRALRSPAAEIAALRGSYLAWLTDQGLPAEVDVRALWEDTVAAVDLAADHAGLLDLHAWTSEHVVAVHEAAGDEDGGALAALPLLLGFLGATGRWSASDADFEAALAAADELADPLAAVVDKLAEVEVEVEVDEDEEDAALRALPVVRQAETLLRFLLPHRQVTGTGALRRGDLPAAAAAVGVDLAERRPRSMWDVPRLAELWEGLVEVGLLTVTSTRATPSPVAHSWISGDEQGGRIARRMVLGGHLVAALAAPTAAPFLPDALETVLSALAAAALGHPVPTDQLFVTGDPEAADDGTAALRGVGALVVEVVLEGLAAEGVLRVTDRVTLAPGLQRVVARTVSALLRDAVDDPEDEDQPPLLGTPSAAAPAGGAWRVRVTLDDTEPPVWRDVLLSPRTGLDQVHEVIQRLFGWEGSHLHEFTASLRRGRVTRFAPPDPDDDWALPGEQARPEAGVRLDQLLDAHRGTLTYRYDFGDCWDHRITVVGTEPAEGALPRCVAGSGAAPQEDSGGPWGWADKVAAAGDPAHPEHEEVRNWLGLRPGEVLDAATFDVADADEGLADLR
jgi:Plasmid pRiA4b ORF-3-like protein